MRGVAIRSSNRAVRSTCDSILHAIYSSIDYGILGYIRIRVTKKQKKIYQIK